MNRYTSIDVVRTIAILFMVPCHFILFLSPNEGFFAPVYVWGNEVLGGLSAPLFLFLVGVSQAVSLQKKPKYQGLFDPTGTRLIRRGLVVFVVGILFQIPIEGDPYEWDVLPFIGAAIVVLSLLRKVPNRFCVSFGVAAFFLAPWLRDIVGYLDYWAPELSPDAYADGFPAFIFDPVDEYLFGKEPHLMTMIIGFFVTGYFPFFPWILFPLIGLVVGRFLYEPGPSSLKRTKKVGVTGILLAGVGCCMAIVGYLKGTYDFEASYLVPFIYFPITPAWCLTQLGFALFVVALCRHFMDGVQLGEHWWFRYCRITSKYSLSIYMLHYLFAYWPVKLYGEFMGDSEAYIASLTNAGVASLISLIALILIYQLCLRWEKVRGKFSMEWVINQFS